MDYECSISNNINLEPKTNSTIAILITMLFIAIIISEYFTRDYLYTLSLSVIFHLQSNASYLTLASTIFTFFATANGIALFVIITYNYANTYKIFLLLLIGLISCYIGGLLKLISVSPRPSWSSSSIASLVCEGEWVTQVITLSSVSHSI